MLLLDHFRKGKAGFPSLLNYFGCVEDGIILNSDGSLMKSFYYYCPDLESSLDIERHNLAVRINGIFAKLNTGWTINIDTARIPVTGYTMKDDYENALLKYFEQQRKENFFAGNTYFETVYALTFVYKPTIIQGNKFKKLFIEGDEGKADQSRNMQDILSDFKSKTEEIKQDLISTGLIVQEMSSDELKRFLQFCITGNNLAVHTPNERCFLNYVLGAYDFQAGLKPKIDNKHIGVVSIVGYPKIGFSGVLDSLNTLPFSYRVSNRFIVLDVMEAEKALRKVLVYWHNKQFNMKQMINQIVMPGAESNYGNIEAQQKAVDVHESITEAQEGTVKYGYYTSAIIVLSEDRGDCIEKMEQIRKCLGASQFASRIENENTIEAYLGSLPGDLKANVRRPLINTLNLAQFMPLNSTWTGDKYNPNPKFPKESSPLFQAVTTGLTPFNFNFYVGDVGHNLTIGATGSGKTTLQAFMGTQFLRYKDAQVFCFDNLMAQYAISKACGAEHFEIMGENSTLSFCPLKDIENESERLWAAQWIEELVALQGIAVTPIERKTITEALEALRFDKEKTLSNFYTNIQNRNIRMALEPFVSIKDGIMSKLLDSSVDNLKLARYQVMDMSRILKTEKRFSIPILLFLFHRIDQRLDGRPTLIQLAETWELLGNETFALKINEWLRQLRAKNASVSFETHSISDIINSPLKDAILSACPTKIFLPNPFASTDDARNLYKMIGLNETQIGLIAGAALKKEYYCTSPLGNRIVDLELSKAFLSLTGRNTKIEIETFKNLEKEHGDLWTAEWFKLCGLEDAAKQWLKLKNKQGF